jgi:DNA repair protein RadC
MTMNNKTSNEIMTVCEVKINYLPKVKPSQRPSLSCAEDIYRLLVENVVFPPASIEHREFFKAMLLNNANKLLGIIHLSEGGVDATVVDIRHIMQAVILANAGKLVLCHNHPSGITSPSTADDKLTTRIKNACDIMNINLVDHIIISSESYYSYADQGRLL